MKINTNSYDDFKTVLEKTGIIARLFYCTDGATPPMMQQVSGITQENTVIMCNAVATTSESTFLGDFPDATKLEMTISYENMK